MSGYVKCPNCSRILKPPGSAPKFKCPCGQILQRPAQVTQPAQTSINVNPIRTLDNPISSTPTRNSAPGRVKCPTCSTVLIPPQNSRIYLCVCGQQLTAPDPNPVIVNPNPPNIPSSPAVLVDESNPRNSVANTSASNPRASRNLGATTGRNQGMIQALRTNFGPMAIRARNNLRKRFFKNRNVIEEQKIEDPNVELSTKEIEKLSPDEVVQLVTGSNQEYWLRNLGQNEMIQWVRLMSSEQEEKIAKLLTTWENDMKKNISKLDEYDLKSRIEMLELFPEADLTNKEEMTKVLLTAADEIKIRASVARLTVVLNNLNVDHTTCVNLNQLTERLMAAVWYGPTRMCDGFVRHFTTSSDGKFDMEMVPAQQYGLQLSFAEHHITYDVLERLSQAPFKKKVEWFREQCGKHQISWEDGRVEMKIKRKNLLQDSFYKLQQLDKSDFKKTFKFEFDGEEGVDAGGLSREWFELITDACFNVDCGLFEYSGVDNITYQFNPNSGVANDLHLEYFRFIGNVVGKALFDHKFINANLTQPIFKHILGYPISVDDIEFCDKDVHQTLVTLEDYEDVSELMLTFTCTISVFGEFVEVELKPGGAEVDVTNANVQEYIMLMTKHYMFERTKDQLVHFLKGVYDVIPEIYLSIFDFREFELLLCGLPSINVEDWKSSAKYLGSFSSKQENHRVCKWFWEYVESRSQEERANLLQYCTGTSRVPVSGFSALQGRSGTVQPFTLQSVSLAKFVYPRAHTCFNRLDLPEYNSKQDLYSRLQEATSLSMTGFNDE